ncbi:MAG TPA: hypothetical protein VEB69_04895 [Acidimicrobiia bacterium]|nr:hypothetical protein [Acidimicrobiia bacterium]
MTTRLINRALGYRDPRAEGVRRALRGFREGDQRELYIGLALWAFAYLRNTTPKKQLLYRKVVPVGSAIVVHHTERGGARLEIRKP